MTSDFSLNFYNYHLPQRLIAQSPLEDRSFSRLLVLNKKTGKVSHHRFYELIDFLVPGDCLILNNSKVFPARLKGEKLTGGAVEVFLLHFPVQISQGKAHANALTRSSKPLKIGQEIRISNDLKIIVKKILNGKTDVELLFNGGLSQVIHKDGLTPLPPYIRRPVNFRDCYAYQTVYAMETGSVAAPTAGFHFTKDHMEDIKKKGINIAWITLHVGYGTFSPIRAQDIRSHQLHSEWVKVPPETVDIIKETKEKGGRIIAVGTTSARAIEGASLTDSGLMPHEGECNLFIMPGYRFGVLDGLITNFHLPGSSLLVLVSAFAGRERILTAYQEAILNEYRFYSYGDAMLII